MKAWRAPLLLLALGLQGTVGARSLTIEDVAAIERPGSPVLSPDGERLIYAITTPDLEANRSTSALWLAWSDNRAAPRRLAISDVGAFNPRWAPDGSNIYFLSPKDGVIQVWRSDAEGKGARPVTAFPLGVQTFRLSPNGRELVIVGSEYADCPNLECTLDRDAAISARKATGVVYDRLYIRSYQQWLDSKRNHLFVLDIDAGGQAQGKPIALTPGFDGDAASSDSDFILSPDGSSAIFQANVGAREPWTKSALWKVPLDGSARPVEIARVKGSDLLSPVLSPDGSRLAYLAIDDVALVDLIVRDLQSGSEARFPLPSYTRRLIWSGDGRLLTVYEEEAAAKLFVLDVATGKARALTETGAVRAFDAAGGSLAYLRSTAVQPSQIFVAGREGQRQITHAGEARLDAVTFSPPRYFAFKGWNGDTVKGWVTPPVGRMPGRRYPALLMIHGGPHNSANDEWSSSWNTQLFAAHGFAVVDINFHGSTGYGRAFFDAIRGHWGDRPLDDLQKGWAAAQERFDFIDPSRACAMGASFGGYMINWIHGVWNAPWRCLVVHAGLLDQRMTWLSSDSPTADSDFGGAVWEVPAAYERFNPVNHVAKWRVPTLVSHGGRDFRMPTEQGIATFQTLQARGIPSEFLYFPEESHALSRPGDIAQWQKAVLAWVERWTAR